MSPIAIQLLCVILMHEFFSSINERKTCSVVLFSFASYLFSHQTMKEFDGKILNLGLHDSDDRSDGAVKLSLCSKM